MSNKTYDLLVLGWGKAGKTLAKKAAISGMSVAVVERDPKMYGGTCINVGCLPTKAMVHYAGLVRESEKLGITRDWNFNQQAFNQARSHRQKFVSMLNTKNYHLLADEDQIDLYLGEAAFKDSKSVTVTGADGTIQTIQAQRIVINTGATPRQLNIPGAVESQRVHYSTEVLELPQLPKRLLVVGSGFIGLEFAAYYAAFGTQVEVYQFDDSWIPSEDNDIAQAVLESLEQQGIKIHFNTVVTQFQDLEAGVRVEFKRNNNSTAEPKNSPVSNSNTNCADGCSAPNYAEFDQVLIAAGRVPNVAGLNLAAAGVELGQYGEIQVDEYLRTNVNNIWAAGDVKGGPQFTFISLDDSRIILPQLLNNAPSHPSRSGDGISARHLNNRPVFATCAFLNPPLARVGYTEKEATAKGLNFTVKKLATAAIPKAHTIAETTGISKVLVGEDGKILGATLFHHEAHEMINLLTLAINQGLDYQVLRDSIYTHPTYTESLNDLLA